jgi:hypothetical protein
MSGLLQAMFDGATRFGLPEDDVWRVIDETLCDVGDDATTAEFLDELAGRLASRIVAAQRETLSGPGAGRGSARGR